MHWALTTLRMELTVCQKQNCYRRIFALLWPKAFPTYLFRRTEDCKNGVRHQCGKPNTGSYKAIAVHRVSRRGAGKGSTGLGSEETGSVPMKLASKSLPEFCLLSRWRVSLGMAVGFLGLPVLNASLSATAARPFHGVEDSLDSWRR